MNTSKKALIIIDVQNDYFPNGNLPLLNTDQTLTNIETAIEKANQQEIPTLVIQHISNPEQGEAPILNQGTSGVEIHPNVLSAAPTAKIVNKEFADCFMQTDLENILNELNVEELLICGMMTQLCVTHTALSSQAEKYKISILADCCTTVDETVHNFALHGLSSTAEIVPTSNAF